MTDLHCKLQHRLLLMVLGLLFCSDAAADVEEIFVPQDGKDRCSSLVSYYFKSPAQSYRFSVQSNNCEKYEDSGTLGQIACTIDFMISDQYMAAAYEICVDHSKQTVDDCYSYIMYAKKSSRHGVPRDLKLIQCASFNFGDELCLKKKELLHVHFRSSNFCTFEGYSTVYLRKLPEFKNIVEMNNGTSCQISPVRADRGTVFSRITEDDPSSVCSLYLKPADKTRYNDVYKFCYKFIYAHFEKDKGSLNIGSGIAASSKTYTYLSHEPHIRSEICFNVYDNARVYVLIKPYYIGVYERRYQHAFIFTYYFQVHYPPADLDLDLDSEEESGNKYIIAVAVVLVIVVVFCYYCCCRNSGKTEIPVASSDEVEGDMLRNPFYEGDPLDTSHAENYPIHIHPPQTIGTTRISVHTEATDPPSSYDVPSQPLPSRVLSTFSAPRTDDSFTHPVIDQPIPMSSLTEDPPPDYYSLFPDKR